ncbi:MAG: hypothetical protein HRU41_05520 [Saprospiraceae bacterium]|nr:hypothetical protein [Saprospiraceae bacterium]
MINPKASYQQNKTVEWLPPRKRHQAEKSFSPLFSYYHVHSIIRRQKRTVPRYPYRDYLLCLLFLFLACGQPQEDSEIQEGNSLAPISNVLHQDAPSEETNHYEDEEIRFPIPSNWTASRKTINDREFIVVLAPGAQAAPGFYIEKVPFQTIYSSRKSSQWLSDLSGNAAFRYIGLAELGKVHQFELLKDGKKIQAATYFRRDFNHKKGYIGAFIAVAAQLEGLNGTKAIRRILEQIEPIDPQLDLDQRHDGPASTGSHATYAPNSTTGQYHSSNMGRVTEMPSKVLSSKELIGQWRVGKIGGTIQQFRSSSNQANQSLFTIRFRANGTYSLKYHATAISGVFMSETDVDETGDYHLRGTALTLTPEKYQGWIYAGTVKNKQAVVDQNPPKRVLQTVAYPNGIGLVGACMPYQVDAFCRGKGDNIIFGLQRP